MKMGVEIFLFLSVLVGVSFDASLGQTTGASLRQTIGGVFGSCGGSYTQESGRFASPQYPSNYPDFSNCGWRISSPGTKNIRLTFIFVDVEESDDCPFDAIRVYDGPSTSSNLLGKLCGNKTRTFKSSRNDLSIVFSSDESGNGQGFVAEWKFEESFLDTTLSPDWTTANINSGPTDTPVEHATTESFLDTTLSPDWTTGYFDPNTTPVEHASTAAPDEITVTAPSSCWGSCGYELGSCSCSSTCERRGNCCYDYYYYCYATTIQAGTPSSCGGSLYNSGSILSPYYPNYYHDNAYCRWQLYAPEGQRVFLSFTDLQLDRCCACDNIEVFDGSTLLATLCFNKTSPKNFQSSSSHMTVVFRSDRSGVARGFKSIFTSSLPKKTATVVCNSETMTVEILQSYLVSLGISMESLYLDDNRCRPSRHGDKIVFSFPIDNCGTQKTTVNSNVVYNNHIRAAPSQSGEITRQIEQFLLKVSCHMEQDTIVGNVYKAEETINSSITGTGRFNANMAFYPPDFSHPIVQVPYEVKLNQHIYVQVQLDRADNTLDLLLESCVASPNRDFQARTYSLLQNGCGTDSTVKIYTNGRFFYAQFHFQAFKFLRTHSYVFLQCRVIVCADSDRNSRCKQGCLRRKKRSLQNDSAHHTETITLGPITLQGGGSAAKAEVED
ncbi:deleted in malignant brain tumors 1 protein-like [Hoplias malabaricus]|uniref:deleted in malignant brain tumors 1 protein-like n=1 Tax=Hoplias malabaricus TaxID=27720 RepID=UPI003462A38C